MKKNSPLAFRISADLKKKLQQVAAKETRSISQICEMFLSIGVRAYEREGAGYLRRYRDNEVDNQ